MRLGFSYNVTGKGKRKNTLVHLAVLSEDNQEQVCHLLDLQGYNCGYSCAFL